MTDTITVICVLIFFLRFVLPCIIIQFK